jgi:hypothetical protein
LREQAAQKLSIVKGLPTDRVERMVIQSNQFSPIEIVSHLISSIEKD